MCGIAGALHLNETRPADELTCVARIMGNAISHRGPDGSGEWVDPNAGISLAHRRLSIIDLSTAGRQPMTSADGRHVLVFNGEIYNFRDLRSELEQAGTMFRGNSDTEVLLEGVASWGLEQTLGRAVGMFAFALWDREVRTLTLARDRVGIKPLYWGRQGETVYFASELKALMAHPEFERVVDRNALESLVRYNYVTGSQSILQGVHQLEPGCFVRIDDTGNVHCRRYWDLAALVVDRETSTNEMSVDETVEDVEALLTTAVHDRMVADVPLGAFLSGGVDSSTVVALMQSVSSSPIKTFSIGFDEAEFDEARHAKQVAAHLGTDHHEFIVSPNAALDVIPKLPTMYCEPFADSSQIPTFLVSEMARDHVTVALSGDGGDEVFGGYNRYIAAAKAWPKLRHIPHGVRRILATALRSVPASAAESLAGLLSGHNRPVQPSDRLNKIATLLGSEDLDAFHAAIVQIWPEADSVVLGTDGRRDSGTQDRLLHRLSDPVTRMQIADMLGYLPGDILTKVDRASMAVGLEARVPLLDHRVIEHVCALPTGSKIRDGRSKLLLRRILDRHVPRSIIDRPKAGFALPLGGWLKGPLREWAEDFLSEKSLIDQGLFDPAPVRRKWADHLAGRRSEQYALWSILMTQAWARHWLRASVD